MKNRIAANWKKTVYYLARNGLKDTYYAMAERLAEREDYQYYEPQEAFLAEQRSRRWEEEPLFSILVPAYRTPEPYLREMIESVLNQSYERLELVIADASGDDSVERVVRKLSREDQNRRGESRVRYLRLSHNGGISENSNQGLKAVRGDYVGLLDHDDLLTPNALYEMVRKISIGKKMGQQIRLLYSDEDKCSEDRSRYYEVHRKKSFDLDLLLSNNYICHFLVMERELIQSLGFRKEYDGAQDYDLVLRAAARLLPEEKAIAHVPEVLYHWRCHSGSTAQNPASKQYAYEAGLRAVQDFTDRMGWKATAYHQKHLGFYGLRYEAELLDARRDIGAVGGRLLGKKHKLTKESGLGRYEGKCDFPGTGWRIVGGALDRRGKILYDRLPAAFSGYMHRAELFQEVQAVDLRLIRVRKECWELFEEATGVPYRTAPGEERFDDSTLPAGTDVLEMSFRLGLALWRAGYRVCWDPRWERRLPAGLRGIRGKGWKKSP